MLTTERRSIIPDRTLGKLKRRKTSPRGVTGAGLSVRGLALNQQPQPKSGNFQPFERRWEVFPARQSAPIDFEPLKPTIDVFKNWGEKGETIAVLQIPGVSLPNGDFEPGDDGVSFSYRVKTIERNDVTVTFYFSPEQAEWECGLNVGTIPLPPELGDAPPWRVHTNNGFTIASFNTSSQL